MARVIPVRPSVPFPKATVAGTGTVSAGGGANTLAWDAVTDPSFDKYRVYFGTAPDTYNQNPGEGIVVATNSYDFSAFAPGTYYFRIAWADEFGNESPYSSEIQRTRS